jgi:hypothetical protein
MKVTSPEMMTALWYLFATHGARIHKKRVVDIMEASEKERTL